MTQKIKIASKQNIRHVLPTHRLTDIHLSYDTEFCSHTHAYYEILLLTRGKTIHYLNNESTTITQRSIAIIKPNNSHAMELFNNYTSEHLNLSISETLFSDLCDSIDKKLFDQFQLNTFKPYVNLNKESFEYILHLADTINTLPLDSTEANLLIKQIVFNILCSFATLEKQDSSYPLWLQDFLQTLSNPTYFVLPINELYKYAPYSQTKLNMYFQKYIGTTIIAHITKQKINYACNLLQNSNFSVLRISNILNYNSLAHFNRIFKKETGKTPREYRLSTQKF